MAKRVLIVDDSMLMRKMLGDILTADGWTVVGEAASGQEAVAKYAEFQPDLVTLDIVMPDTDGIYALQNILRFDPQAKVVVISALNQTKLVSEAIRKGPWISSSSRSCPSNCKRPCGSTWTRRSRSAETPGTARLSQRARSG